MRALPVLALAILLAGPARALAPPEAPPPPLQGLPLSAQTFGAIGDGIADDTAAVAAWLSSGNQLTCNGTFRITGPVVVSLPVGSGLSVQGAGRQLCRFVLGTPSARIAVTGTRPDFYGTPQIVLHDLSIVPDAAIPAAALSIAYTGGSGSTDPVADIRNVAVKPSAPTNYALTCFAFTNVRNSTVDNVDCEGARDRFVPGSRGILLGGEGAPVEVNFRGINLYFVEQGFTLEGNWEGVSISGSVCVVCRVGVSASSSGITSNWLRVFDSHFNVASAGVVLRNIWNAHLYDNLTLLDARTWSASGGPAVCYQATMASTVTAHTTIHDNGCDGFGRRGTERVGVLVDGAPPPSVLDTLVHHNSLSNLDVGVQLGADARGVVVGPNTTSGVGAAIRNLAAPGANAQAPLSPL